jgi:hypothetical protein
MRFVLSCIWLAVFSSCAAAAPPSPNDLSKNIQAVGAKAVVDDLVKNNQWDKITTFMAQGQSNWISLAPSLAQGSDAGTSEDLGMALAFGLPKSPRAVLAAIDPQNGPVLGVDRVCGVPFIEGTISDVNGYIKQAIAAVSAVNDPSLAGVKAACLKDLN